MSAPGPQYEFTEQQNQLIGSLAAKMRFVGLFAVVLGVINLVMALLVVLAIYRDRLPPGWAEKIREAQARAKESLPEDYSADRLPPNNQLWGVALNAGAAGLFYLLLGAWTRSAGTSFQRIVDTRGSDVTHLMDALASLHSMYALIYALLVVVLLLGLVGLALTLWQGFAR